MLEHYWILLLDRQGDSLSPLLFSILMDKIVNYLENPQGYRMGNDINMVHTTPPSLFNSNSIRRFNVAFQELYNNLNLEPNKS